MTLACLVGAFLYSPAAPGDELRTSRVPPGHRPPEGPEGCEVLLSAMDRLADDAIEAGLQGLLWSRQGEALVRVVQRSNFAEAMEVVNGVAQLAEGANHHPDIHISWSKVTLELSTHSAGGITQNDLDLAAAIDGLVPD